MIFRIKSYNRNGRLIEDGALISLPALEELLAEINNRISLLGKGEETA